MMSSESRIATVAPAAAIVIIPCLNEMSYIEGTLAHFMAESVTSVCKIIVSDGGSTDRTLRIVEEYAMRDPRIVIVHNARRIQSSGVNRAVEKYGDLARFLIRADAHASYPAGFCTKLLEVQHTTGAEAVVVSMIAEGAACFQSAAAAAQNSLLGNGGSAHRRAAHGRFVDHGHHALMEVSAFRSVGGYDESFSYNEDAELDYRLGARGYRIFLCAGADIKYYPRKGPLSLFRQYRNFGYGRATNMLKHRARPKLRQMIPVAVGPAIALSILSPLAWIFAVPSISWATLCLMMGIREGFRKKTLCACGAGIAAMLMHTGFSIGFISRIIKFGAAGGRLSDGTTYSAAHDAASEQ